MFDNDVLNGDSRLSPALSTGELQGDNFVPSHPIRVSLSVPATLSPSLTNLHPSVTIRTPTPISSIAIPPNLHTNYYMPDFTHIICSYINFHSQNAYLYKQ